MANPIPWKILNHGDFKFHDIFGKRLEAQSKKSPELKKLEFAFGIFERKKS